MSLALVPNPAGAAAVPPLAQPLPVPPGGSSVSPRPADALPAKGVLGPAVSRSTADRAIASTPAQRGGGAGVTERYVQSPKAFSVEMTPDQGAYLNRIGAVIDRLAEYPKVSFEYQGKTYLAETSRVRGPMAYRANLTITHQTAPNAKEPGASVSFDAATQRMTSSDPPLIYVDGVAAADVDGLLAAATRAIEAAGAKGSPKR